MDELLYLVALIAGIGGAFYLWNYSKAKKAAAVQKRKK